MQNSHLSLVESDGKKEMASPMDSVQNSEDKNDQDIIVFTEGIFQTNLNITVDFFYTAV